MTAADLAEEVELLRVLEAMRADPGHPLDALAAARLDGYIGGLSIATGHGPYPEPTG
jgi:hypothetical protein